MQADQEFDVTRLSPADGAADNFPIVTIHGRRKINPERRRVVGMSGEMSRANFPCDKSVTQVNFL
jgi:hypothetical protein